MKRKTLANGTKVAVGIILSVILMFPLYWMVNVSLTQPADLVSTSPSLFPLDPTFAGYKLAFERNIGAIWTTIFIALGSVSITLLVAVPAAYGMVKLYAPGSKALMVAFLLAQMLPSVVVVTALFTLYKQIGLLNTHLGLMLADSTASIPLAVIILQAFMMQLPDELLEAAKVDGAGRIRTFVSIVVPLSRNAIVTSALFAFLFAWGDFINANTLASGGNITPLTLSLYRFIGAQATNWNGVMATAVIASVPAAFLLVFAQKYIAAGVTAGAVKD